jgi:hypothetical protein
MLVHRTIDWFPRRTTRGVQREYLQRKSAWRHLTGPHQQRAAATESFGIEFDKASVRFAWCRWTDVWPIPSCPTIALRAATLQHVRPVYRIPLRRVAGGVFLRDDKIGRPWRVSPLREPANVSGRSGCSLDTPPVLFPREELAAFAGRLMEHWSHAKHRTFTMCGAAGELQRRRSRGFQCSSVDGASSRLIRPPDNHRTSHKHVSLMQFSCTQPAVYCDILAQALGREK